MGSGERWKGGKVTWSALNNLEKRGMSSYRLSDDGNFRFIVYYIIRLFGVISILIGVPISLP